MKVCQLNSSDFSTYFGTRETPITRNAVIIGRLPDDSAFLILTDDTDTYLVNNPELSKFIFTYCQSWGLVVNQESITRAWNDIRAKAYPSIGNQLDMLYKAGLGGADFISAIQAVKDKYTELTF